MRVDDFIYDINVTSAVLFIVKCPLSSTYARMIPGPECELMTSLNRHPLSTASHYLYLLNVHAQSCDHLHDGIGTICFILRPLLLLLDDALQLWLVSVGNDRQ